MGLRLFADQCIPTIVIESLRSAGHEVMSLKDYLSANPDWHTIKVNFSW